MTAAYLISPFQKTLLAQLRQISTDSENFFVDAPLVIDCREDAEAFRSQLTTRQLFSIAKDYADGRLKYVSQLAFPAYQYARGKLKERHRQLDKATLQDLRSFLERWNREVGKRPGQPGKSRPEAFGIDIIMPLSGARLSYDLSSLVGL